jgi:hypothetical protein
MNRRKFLAFLAAGGVVTATGLWLPGQKLISIPSGKRLDSDYRTYIESWRKLPNGNWLEMLTSEDSIIMQQERQYCPYKLLFGSFPPEGNPAIASRNRIIDENGVTWVTQEYYLPADKPIWW